MSTQRVVEDGAARMDALWQGMTAIYGSRWGAVYGGDDMLLVMRGWSDALEGFSDADLARGVKGATDSYVPHPPVLGQFKRWCMGFADETKAVAAALSGTAVDPVSLVLLRKASSHEKKSLSAAALRKRYEELLPLAYEEAERVFMGAEKAEALPRPERGRLPPRAGASVDRAASIKTANEAMDNIFAKLGAKRPEPEEEAS